MTLKDIRWNRNACAWEVYIEDHFHKFMFYTKTEALREARAIRKDIITKRKHLTNKSKW